MRERVILSIANNAAINREARANAIDDTTRARNEGFNVDVYFLADYCQNSGHVTWSRDALRRILIVALYSRSIL